MTVHGTGSARLVPTGQQPGSARVVVGTGVRPHARRPAVTAGARGRWALVAAAAVLTAAGCTVTGSTPPRPAPVVATTPSPPAMTAVPEAAECTVRRDLGTGGDAKLPFGDVFGPGVARGIDGNDEYRPGAGDARDSRCQQELPDGASLSCEQAVPWVSADWTNHLTAFGARQVRRVSVSSEEPGIGGGPRRSRTVSYAEVDFWAGDTKGVVEFLTAAFRSCARGVTSNVGGVPAIVGLVPSLTNQSGDVTAAAFLGQERVAWVVLDGRPWTKPERDRALTVVARRVR